MSDRNQPYPPHHQPGHGQFHPKQQFPGHPQQPMQQPPPQPPQKKKHTGLKVVGGSVGGLIVIIALVNMGAGSNEIVTTGPVAATATRAAADIELATGPTTRAPAAVPVEYKAALKSAQTYSDRMHMSRQGLFDQLTSEYGGRFPEDAARYAVDNVKADWNQNALESARNYQENLSLSKEAIRDQLTSEYGGKFTQEQADYAVENL